ncbi:MAG: hypothetical protein WAK91_08185 [Candidatus Acidiferrales bacterium]|jgi:hypothetical protein
MAANKISKAGKKRSAKTAPRKAATSSTRGTNSEQTAQFRAVFAAMRAMLETLAPRLRVATDKPDNYYLNTVSPSGKGKPLAFAAVQIKKNYVSYHLVPVYMNPGLLAGMSPELKKHMQGKGCFNFTEVDMILFMELAVLTTAGFREYERKGLL